ncbi:hypothetical protein DXG01_014456 [Tephrocybe rancida]|nr:hypothetical protein DXG01_014456 [Tephrocybe rancida]
MFLHGARLAITRNGLPKFFGSKWARKTLESQKLQLHEEDGGGVGKKCVVRGKVEAKIHTIILPGDWSLMNFVAPISIAPALSNFELDALEPPTVSQKKKTFEIVI